MSNEKQTRKEELDLKKLEFQVDELIRTCERLKSENRTFAVSINRWRRNAPT